LCSNNTLYIWEVKNRHTPTSHKTGEGEVGGAEKGMSALI